MSLLGIDPLLVLGLPCIQSENEMLRTGEGKNNDRLNRRRPPPLWTGGWVFWYNQLRDRSYSNASIHITHIRPVTPVLIRPVTHVLIRPVTRVLIIPVIHVLIHR